MSMVQKRYVFCGISREPGKEEQPRTEKFTFIKGAIISNSREEASESTGDWRKTVGFSTDAYKRCQDAVYPEANSRATHRLPVHLSNPLFLSFLIYKVEMMMILASCV